MLQFLVRVKVRANGISFANDITALAPKDIKIRHGVIIAALYQWVILASTTLFSKYILKHYKVTRLRLRS
jgi:cytosine/uracil/thiamine/allantoin permease